MKLYFLDNTSNQFIYSCLIHTSPTFNGRRTPWRRFGRFTRKKTIGPPKLDFPEPMKIGLAPEEMYGVRFNIVIKIMNKSTVLL